MCKTYWFFLLLVLIIRPDLQAQVSNVQIENITLSNGQQLTGIWDITQDTTGLIWFHTYEPSALYTYDGNTLEKMPDSGPNYQLPDTFFLYAPPRDSVFYITDPTASDTIISFDPHRRAVTGYLTKWWMMSSFRVNSQGTKWFYAYDPNQDFVINSINMDDQIHSIDTILLNWSYSMVGIWNDQYYVKMRDQVFVYNDEELANTYPFYPQGPVPMSSSCVADADSTLWAVYSPDGFHEDLTLFYLRPGMEEFQPYPGQEAMTKYGSFGKVYFDGEDVWYRSSPFHLFRKKKGSPHFEDLTAEIIRQEDNFPFYNSEIYTIFRDRSDQVWIATRSGLVKMSLEEDLFQKYAIDQGVDQRCPTGDCPIRGVGEDGQGNVYFSYVHGVAQLDAAEQTINRLPYDISLPGKLLHPFHYDQNKLYVKEFEIDLDAGTSQSLFPKDFNLNMARGIDPVSRRMWTVMYHPPAYFYTRNLDSGDQSRVQLPDPVMYGVNDEIRKLHYSANTGSIFLATMQQGLSELRENGEVIQLDLCSNHVNDFYEDEQQQLWVASNPGGLTKIDLNTRQFTAIPYRIDPEMGPLKKVYHILPQGEHYLWLIGVQGIFRLDKSSGELTSFPMFSSFSKMGFFRLPNFVGSDGTFYLGMIDGSVHAFRPEELVQQARLEERFPIALTRYSRYNAGEDSIFIQQDHLVELEEIRLTHRDRYFTLDFFVPDFRNTRENRYTYYMEGYDREWSNPSKANQLQYENLPPGSYTLRIRGGLSKAYFPSSERVIQVTVLQAWYKTGWAIMAYVLLLLGAVLLAYRYQLRRKLEIAEAVRIREFDALKTSFYTNITHEFRTPLTVILGVIDQIRGFDTERQLIRRNGKGLLRLVNQLLDLSKTEAGQMSLDLVQGDIMAYLGYLTASFQSIAQEKQIRLTFSASSGALVMDFDEHKIQQILYNLLSNALKFTPLGGEVQVTAEEAEPGRLLLAVRDTGIGIAPAELPHIFNRFYQVDGTATRSGEGTGIGLALTRELVKLMDGDIRVESRPDHGTSCLVYLPIRRTAGTKAEPYDLPHDKEALALIPAASNPAERQQAGRKDLPLLLIVEDNPDVIYYLRHSIGDRFKVLLAHDGQEGLELATEYIPDIIISDVMMPRMDGYELTQKLKTDHRTSHIPIILLTARADQPSRMSGLRQGADAYLTKPFDQEELLLRLSKLLELRRVLQEKYREGNPAAEPASREPNLDELFLLEIEQVIKTRLNESELGITHFCAAVNLSYTQVYRKIKALTGLTPTSLIRNRRLQHAKSLLEGTTLSVSEVAYEVGFNDPNYFSRVFREKFGTSPSKLP